MGDHRAVDSLLESVEQIPRFILEPINLGAVFVFNALRVYSKERSLDYTFQNLLKFGHSDYR